MKISSFSYRMPFDIGELQPLQDPFQHNNNLGRLSQVFRCRVLRGYLPMKIQRENDGEIRTEGYGISKWRTTLYPSTSSFPSRPEDETYIFILLNGFLLNTCHTCQHINSSLTHTDQLSVSNSTHNYVVKFKNRRDRLRHRFANIWGTYLCQNPPSMGIECSFKFREWLSGMYT